MESTKVMTHSSTFLLPSPPLLLPSRLQANGDAALTYTLIVLNSASLIHSSHLELRFKPDVIKEHMDSIRSDVKEYYINSGVKIVDSSSDRTYQIYKERGRGGRGRDQMAAATITSSPSFSLKFTFAIAFSFSALTLSSPSPQSLPFLSRPKISPKSSLSSPSDLASDVLSLLGGAQEASRVPAKEADDIRSCLRFLVPFQKLPEGPRGRRELLADKKEVEDEMVRWPPPPVMELSRLAVDSGGSPAVIQRSLDPTVLKVPDVEGLMKDKCQLTRTPTAFRFSNKELNSYFAFLFEMISARAPLMGFNVSLNRYDLFHGHLFLASDTGRLGILFHAKEYPAYDKKVFPYHMGYCQKGSNVVYDDCMNLRNILWLAPLPSNAKKAWAAPGTLVVLDAHPGGIIYKELVSEYVDYVRTIYEDDFGEVVADVNYLNVGNVVPGDKIFIC